MYNYSAIYPFRILMVTFNSCIRCLLTISALFQPSTYASTTIFDVEWEARTWIDPDSAIEKELPAEVASATFTITAIDTVNIVRQTLFGNNAAAWTGNVPDRPGVRMWEDDRAVHHLKNAQIKTLRIPGGAWGNIWLWDGDSTHWKLNPTLTTNSAFQNQFKSWTMSFDEMLRLCDSAGATPQIIVNAALAQFIDEPDPVAKAAHYAAECVRYVNGTLGRDVRYWEVNNEDYGKWMVNYEVDGDPFTGIEYGTLFTVFSDSMKQADSSIKIGAVIYPQFSLYPSNIRNNWTQEVLATAGTSMDFIVIHEYFTWADPIDSVPFDSVMTGRHRIARYKKNLDSLSIALTGHTIPIAMTEYNMRAGNKNTEMVSALFIAEALGEFARSGYGLVNLWQIYNGSGSDDHGMLARKDWEGSTVVTQSQVEEFMPHPSFFSYYYYRRYFGDIVLQSSGDNTQLHLTSSRFSNGTFGMILVNQSGEPTTTALTVTNNISLSHIYWHTITADSLGSRRIRINGIGPAETQIYGPPDYEHIPPFTAALTTPQSTVSFNAPPYSVSFIAVQPSGEASTHLPHPVPQFPSCPVVRYAAITNGPGKSAVLRLTLVRPVSLLKLRLLDLLGREVCLKMLHHSSTGICRVPLNRGCTHIHLLECTADGSRYIIPLVPGSY